MGGMSEASIPSRLDRSKARDVLRRARATSRNAGASEDALLDALEACVTPAPAHTIDRDVLTQFLNHSTTRLLNPYWVNATANGILALLRPVEGVVLTREEAALALGWSTFDHGFDLDEKLLIRRLRAATS